MENKYKSITIEFDEEHTPQETIAEVLRLLGGEYGDNYSMITSGFCPNFEVSRNEDYVEPQELENIEIKDIKIDAECNLCGKKLKVTEMDGENFWAVCPDYMDDDEHTSLYLKIKDYIEPVEAESFE